MNDERRRSVRKYIFRGIAVGGALAVVAVVAVSWWIGASVRSVGDAAVREVGGDRVEALMQVVDSPSHPLAERNRAVWALGQLGDERALPTLEAYYTGQPCDHRRALCQHELHKAIDGCSGAFNLSALVWRHGSVVGGSK